MRRSTMGAREMKEMLESVFGKEFFEFVAIVIFMIVKAFFISLFAFMAVELFHTLDVIFLGN